MDIRLNDHFDDATFLRGCDYATRGCVLSIQLQGDGV